MKVLVIASHPDIKKSIINRAWIEELGEDKEIDVRLIDEIYKDRDIDVEREKEYWSACDRVVLQFPFYWYSVPAFLKKYMDEVLVEGWAYGESGNKLHGKELLIATSLGAPAYTFEGGAFNNYSMTELLRPLQATAKFIQMTYVPPYLQYDVHNLSEKEIKLSAKHFREYISREDLNTAQKTY